MKEIRNLDDLDPGAFFRAEFGKMSFNLENKKPFFHRNSRERRIWDTDGNSAENIFWKKVSLNFKSDC